MKNRFIITLFTMLLFHNVLGQRESIELTFTAIDSSAWQQLDSIKVLNRSREGKTVLYWPDTVLTINIVGIEENPGGNESIHLFQNYPNPFSDQTTISFFIPEKDKVTIIATDILGGKILETERVLDKGIHTFSFTPGGVKLSFITVLWKGISNSIKIIQIGHQSYSLASLDYLGSKINSTPPMTGRQVQDLNFQTGDELLFIGYSNGLQSGILDRPETSKTYTFQYATNIPCLGTPTVEYGDQVYNTIQEWKVLEGAVDTRYGIGDPEWDRYWAYRGKDAGTNLKTTIGWYENGNDSFGFSGLPGGNRDYFLRIFLKVGYNACFWTSTVEDNTAWFRDIYCSPEITRGYFNKEDGYSVRCLRDY